MHDSHIVLAVAKTNGGGISGSLAARYVVSERDKKLVPYMPIGFYSPGMSQVLAYGVIIFYNRNSLMKYSRMQISLLRVRFWKLSDIKDKLLG